MIKTEIIQRIENEIKLLSTDLSRKVSDIKGISFRKEHHFEVNKREYIVELVVMKYVNEDDYGPSLTVCLELNEFYQLDLSVIRGYGELIAQRVVTFTEQTVKDLDIHILFNEMGDQLIMALRKLYLEEP